MSDDLWQRGCTQLAAELPEQQYNTWIRPLPAGEVSTSLDAAGSTVVSLKVPNRFKLDWIRSQYAARIEGVLSGLAGKPIKLDLQLAPREAGAPGGMNGPALNSYAAPSSSFSSTSEPTSEAAARAARSLAGTRAPVFQPQHRLNAALTFDTLVAGRANQMARTAALHVAGAPGQMYNPLFIYGGVGLGKTHLIHAVGNALLRDRPDARILYLHAEQFISDVVKNYQRKTFDELKAKYHNLDLLLIDRKSTRLNSSHRP